jgi:putative NADH-flavin reductase
MAHVFAGTPPASSRISYADHAIALIDEIETPKRHRIHLGVEQG